MVKPGLVTLPKWQLQDYSSSPWGEATNQAGLVPQTLKGLCCALGLTHELWWEEAALPRAGNKGTSVSAEAWEHSLRGGPRCPELEGGGLRGEVGGAEPAPSLT